MTSWSEEGKRGSTCISRGTHSHCPDDTCSPASEGQILSFHGTFCLSSGVGHRKNPLGKTTKRFNKAERRKSHAGETLGKMMIPTCVGLTLNLSSLEALPALPLFFSGGSVGCRSLLHSFLSVQHSMDLL